MKAKATHSIDTLRGIIEHHQHSRLTFNAGPTCAVDVQTANAILLVYDALNEANQAKVRGMLTTHKGFKRLINFAWSQVRSAA